MRNFPSLPTINKTFFSKKNTPDLPGNQVHYRSVSSDGDRDFCEFLEYPPLAGKVPVAEHEMFVGMPYSHPVQDGNKSK